MARCRVSSRSPITVIRHLYVSHRVDQVRTKALSASNVLVTVPLLVFQQTVNVHCD